MGRVVPQVGVGKAERKKARKWAGLSLRLGVERRKERKLGKWDGLSLRLGVERRKERKCRKHVPVAMQSRDTEKSRYRGEKK